MDVARIKTGSEQYVQARQVFAGVCNPRYTLTGTDANGQTDATPTIEQAFEWYRKVKLIGCKSETLNHYRLDMRRLDKFLERQATLADVNDETIGAAMQWMLDTGSARATVNKFLTVWRAFGNFAARKGLCDSIELGRVAEARKTPTAWTIDQIERLISACDSPRRMANGVREGLFLKALILTLYCTGERISAVLSARWKDLTGDTLLVHAANRKGGRADMVHRLSAEALSAVEAIRKPERACIFDWPFTTATLTSRFDKLCESAGIPPEPRNKWHKLRRTCATHVDANGGDATRVLGHSTPGLARKSYIDPTISKRPSAADVLPAVQQQPEPQDSGTPAMVLPEDLTERQLQVARGIASGTSYREMGEQLGISASTAECYASRLRDKLGAPTNAHVARWADRNGVATAWPV